MLDELIWGDSLKVIEQDPKLSLRLSKPMPRQEQGQGCRLFNRRDTMLMSVFCHPRVSQWEKLNEIFDCDQVLPQLFCAAPLKIRDSSLDPTSIDLLVGDTFVQTATTERDFTRQRVDVVEKYLYFQEAFHASELRRADDKYLSFRVIRNLLAAYQYRKRHALLCDRRRTDLIEAYYNTVEALRDDALRSQCRVVFWQDLLSGIDSDISNFIETRFNLLPERQSG